MGALSSKVGDPKKKKKKDKDGALLDPSAKKLAKEARGRIWAMLLPKMKLGDKGLLEMLALFALHSYQVYQTHQVTKMVYLGDRLLYTRVWADYVGIEKVLWRLAVTSTLLHQCKDYIKRRLGLIWRTKLTAQLHARYFAGTNYYQIENKIQDVDDRMTEAVSEVCSGYAEFLNAALNQSTTGVFFLAKLALEYGVGYALAPFLYIAVAQRFCVDGLVKMDFSVFQRQGAAKAVYRAAQTRVVVHSEAITALRGGEREESILRASFDNVVASVVEVQRRLLPYQAASNFFMRRMFLNFNAWFILGPGVFAAASAQSNTIDAISHVRGEVGYQFVLFGNVAAAAAYLNAAVTNFRKMQGPAVRICELFDLLKVTSEESASQGSSAFERSPPGDDARIAFEDVDIYTPSNVLLVRDLSFELTSHHDSLLLTGHNGAGKSSLFRCLSGIWKIRKGKIVKPMVSGTDEEALSSLSSDIFYLPQKPYNVTGTLVDQITYPQKASETAELSRDYLRGLLRLVELEYLADDEGNFSDAEINWEDRMSLGEKQRLAIARLLHTKPRFAILDECTSGVNAAMERRLYHLLNRENICYVTISHRPMLEAMHCKFLCINGDDEKSYTYKTLRTPEELRRTLASDAGPEEEAVVVAVGAANAAGKSVGAEERAAVYSHVKVEREERHRRTQDSVKSGGTLSQLRSLLSGALSPSQTKGHVARVVLGMLSSTIFEDLGIINMSQLFSALFQRSPQLFFRTMVFGVLISGLAEAAAQFTTYNQNKLQIGLMEGITRKLTRKYIAKAGYYSLKTIDGRIKDPETRITDDVDAAVTLLTSLLTEVIQPIIKIVSLGARLYVSAGASFASFLYGYLVVAAVVARWVMPNYRAMISRRNAVVGKYKFSHASVRTHCEAIAFFGGGERERALATERFQLVIKEDWAKLSSDFCYGCYKSFFIFQVPDRIQQYGRVRYAIDNFTDEDILADGGASCSHSQHVIWQVSVNVRSLINQMVEVSDKFSNLSGVIMRLHELDTVLDEIPLPPFLDGQSVAQASAAKPENPTLTVRNLDIVTPAGEALCLGVNVEASRSQRLMITGPNASGKTSFFRVLGGLWRAEPPTASIECNGDLFLIPQRVYSVTGTLLDQVTYPAFVPEDFVTDELLAKAQNLLDLVGIGFLSSREGWHKQQKYEDVLSLGEQQRLGMARLFYRNPSFAVLDECTDAVSVDVENELYRAATDMGITCLTISKRLALADYHENELRLGAETKMGHSVLKIE